MHSISAFIYFLLFIACIPAAAAAEVERQSTRFVYTINSLDSTVANYGYGVDGYLRFRFHIPVPKNPKAIAIDPAQRMLYVVSKTAESVSVFHIDKQNGGLTPVANSPFAAHVDSPYSIDFHPSGRFVYMAARAGVVAGFAINEKTTDLKPLPGSPYPAGNRTRSLRVHPSGRFVFASNAYSNSISVYSLAQDSGVLSEIKGSPFFAGDQVDTAKVVRPLLDIPPEAGAIPYYVTTDPAGRFLLVTNWLAGSISVFRINTQTGVLSAVPDSPFRTGLNPYAVTVHPSGRFVYVSSWVDSGVWAYRLDANSGTLSALSQVPVALGGSGPVSLRFDASGARLYVANSESSSMAVFDVNSQSGELQAIERMHTRPGVWDMVAVDGAPLDSATYAVTQVQGGAVVIARLDQEKGDWVSPQSLLKKSEPLHQVQSVGGRLHIGFKGDAALQIVTRDIGTGRFELGAPIKSATAFSQWSMDSNAQYAYMLDANDTQLWAQPMNPSVAVQPYWQQTLGPSNKALAADPMGRYLFVADETRQRIHVYGFRRNDGPNIYERRSYGSPFTTLPNPSALAIDRTGQWLVVASAKQRQLMAQRIHYQSGALAAPLSRSVTTDGMPRAMEIHPSGRWVLVALENPNSLAVISLDSMGNLAATSQQLKLPFPPTQLALTADGQQVLIAADSGGWVQRVAVSDAGELRDLGKLSIAAVKRLRLVTILP